MVANGASVVRTSLVRYARYVIDGGTIVAGRSWAYMPWVVGGDGPIRHAIGMSLIAYARRAVEAATTQGKALLVGAASTATGARDLATAGVYFAVFKALAIFRCSFSVGSVFVANAFSSLFEPFCASTSKIATAFW